MGNVHVLRSLSTHNKLLRTSVLHCGGSNQKVRQFLGLSAGAGVTIVGLGVSEVLRNKWSEGNSLRRWKIDRDKGQEQPFWSQFNSLLIKKKFQETSSILQSVSIFTVASCEESGSESGPASGSSGEDTICNCCVPRPKKRAGFLPSVFSPPVLLPPSVVQCDCNCADCVAKCSRKDDNGSVIPGNLQGSPVPIQNQSAPPPPPPIVTAPPELPPPSSPSEPPAKGASCSGTNTGPVSNKPCRGGAKQSCSQVSEIDIDELTKQLGTLTRIDFVVGDSDLSHCFLMKQASQVTVDSVTRVLTEVAAAYQSYHDEYRRILDMMMDTLEESRKVCGAELEVVECKVILLRAKLDEMKRRISDVDMLLASVEKLSTAAAEVAFMANADYASVAMSERLQSLISEVKRLRTDSKEKERDMLELQALIIVESGKSLK